MIAFILLSILLILSALGVLFFHNPINNALSLIANMMGIAAMFALLDAHFLAAVQIIVYAGAVMVLVVFVLMLLNIKEEAPRKTSGIFMVTCLLAGILFMYFGAPIIYNAFSQVRPADPNFNGSMQSLGKLLYSNYVFPFEAASILIMAAVAGAVMLAKRKFR